MRDPYRLAVLLFCAACGGKSSNPGPLVLDAYGGPSGHVAADVRLTEPGVGQQRTCTASVNAGACQFTSCKLGGIGSPGVGFGDFGPITVSVGSTDVPLTYGGFGYGTVYFPDGVTLGTGGKMRFRGGGGGGVPEFDVSATIPGLGTLTSPVPAADGGVAIDTSQDLAVAWSPISIGQILFEIYGGVPSPGAVANSIDCTYDGASGGGVVPQALLSSMKDMSGVDPVYADLGSKLEATTIVDGLTIITQSSQSSGGANQTLNVMFQ